MPSLNRDFHISSEGIGFYLRAHLYLKLHLYVLSKDVKFIA